MSKTLEDAARLAWQKWGHNWCFNGQCSGCGEQKIVRGKTKRRLLCLECFDKG